MLKNQVKGPMKGLNQFIVDLRNSKDQEEELKKISHEVNNIRSKMQSFSSLNGSQRKKYICKLIYVYILGNPDLVDFGFRESKELLASSNYGEKKLGYLAVSILLNSQEFGKRPLFTAKEHLNHALTEIHEYLVQDLQSQDDEVNCLAIQMIATCFTTSDVIIQNTDKNAFKWMEIIDMVYASLTSPINKPVVKQKAAIALKSLLQIYPDVLIKNNNWTPRILKVIEESKDFSVVLSSIGLLNLILQQSPDKVRSVIPSVAQRLYSIVVENQCPPQYYYYDTPAPWLVVKLFQFVEHFFLAYRDLKTKAPAGEFVDIETLNKLRQCVSKSIKVASHNVKGLPNRNSQSSILFQAVSLAVFLEASPEAINGASNALLMLISTSDTNTRYLALDALIKLIGRLESSNLSSPEAFKDNLPLFTKLLHEKDISIRRKALDLLYTLCDSSNFTLVLNELLEYFPHADLNMKSELSVKIAVLAENFATDSTWYVSTILKLLSIGGGSNANGSSFIDKEIWERIVQIIVNNDDLQKKACKIIINLIKKPFSSAPANIVSSESLIKVAAFILGEFGEQVGDLEDLSIEVQFRLLYTAYFGVSLATRALLLTSFLKILVKNPDLTFVPDIIDLFEAEVQSIDLEIQTRAYEYLKLSTMHSDFRLAKNVVRGIPAFNQKENPFLSRLGVVSKQPGLSRSLSAVMAKNIKSRPEDTANGNGSNSLKKALTRNWYSGYHRMLHFDAGIFYEDQLVKLTYRIVKNNAMLCIKFTIINLAYKAVGRNITGFNVLDVESFAKEQNPTYTIHIKLRPQADFSDKTQMDVEVSIRGIVENGEDPVMSLNFMCGGSFNQLHLKVPVSLLKTISPTPLNSGADFERRWTQIGLHLGAEGESSMVVNLAHRHDEAALERSLTRIGFAVIPNYNSDPYAEERKITCGAGIVHTAKTNYGVLIKIESMNVTGKDFTFTVRCTGGGVAPVIMHTLQEIFVGRY